MIRPRPDIGLCVLTACMVIGVQLRLDTRELCGGDKPQPVAAVRPPAATTQASSEDLPSGLAVDQLRERRFWRDLRSNNPMVRRRVDSVAALLLVPPAGHQRDEWLKEWHKWIECRAYWRRRFDPSALDDVLGEVTTAQERRPKKPVTLFVSVDNRSDYVLNFEESMWCSLAEGVLCHGLETIWPRETGIASARVHLRKRSTSPSTGPKLAKPKPVELRLPLRVKWDQRQRVSRRRAKRLRRLELEFTLVIRVSESPGRPLSRVTTQIVLNEDAERRHQQRVREFLAD